MAATRPSDANTPTPANTHANALDSLLSQFDDDVFSLLSDYAADAGADAKPPSLPLLRRVGSLPRSFKTPPAHAFIAAHNRLSASSIHSTPVALSDIELSHAESAAVLHADRRPPPATETARVLIASSSAAAAARDLDYVGVDAFIDGNQHHIQVPFLPNVARRRFLGGNSPNDDAAVYTAASVVLDDVEDDSVSFCAASEAPLSAAAEPASAIHMNPIPASNTVSPTTQIKNLQDTLAETKLATRTVIKGLLNDIQSEKHSSESALQALGNSLDASREETRNLQLELDKLASERQEMLSLIDCIACLFGNGSENAKSTVYELVHSLEQKLDHAYLTTTPANEPDLNMCQVSECSSSIHERDDAQDSCKLKAQQYPISPTSPVLHKHKRLSIMTRNSLQTLQDTCTTLLHTLKDSVHPKLDQVIHENKRCAFENLRMAELVIKAVETSNKEEDEGVIASSTSTDASTEAATTSVIKKSTELLSYIGGNGAAALAGSGTPASSVVGTSGAIVLNQIRKGSNDLGQLIFRSAAGAAAGGTSSVGGANLSAIERGSNSELRPTLMQRLAGVVAGKTADSCYAAEPCGDQEMKRSNTVTSKLLDAVMKSSESLAKDMDPLSSEEEENFDDDDSERASIQSTPLVEKRAPIYGPPVLKSEELLEGDEYTYSTMADCGTSEEEDSTRDNSPAQNYDSMDERDSLGGRRGRVFRLVPTSALSMRSKSLAGSLQIHERALDTPKDGQGREADTCIGAIPAGLISSPVVGESQSAFFSGPLLNPLAPVSVTKNSVSGGGASVTGEKESTIARVQNIVNGLENQRTGLIVEKYEKSRTGEWWENLKRETEEKKKAAVAVTGRSKSYHSVVVGKGTSAEKIYGATTSRQSSGSISTGDQDDLLRDRVLSATQVALDRFTNSHGGVGVAVPVFEEEDKKRHAEFLESSRGLSMDVQKLIETGQVPGAVNIQPVVNSQSLGRVGSQKKGSDQTSAGSSWWRGLSKAGNDGTSKQSHRVSDPIPKSMQRTFSMGLRGRNNRDSASESVLSTPPVPDLPDQFKKSVSGSVGKNGVLEVGSVVGLIGARTSITRGMDGMTSPVSSSSGAGWSDGHVSDGGALNGNSSVGLGGLMRKLSTKKKVSSWKLAKK